MRWQARSISHTNCKDTNFFSIHQIFFGVLNIYCILEAIPYRHGPHHRRTLSLQLAVVGAGEGFEKPKKTSCLVVALLDGKEMNFIMVYLLQGFRIGKWHIIIHLAGGNVDTMPEPFVRDGFTVVEWGGSELVK